MIRQGSQIWSVYCRSRTPCRCYSGKWHQRSSILLIRKECSALGQHRVTENDPRKLRIPEACHVELEHICHWNSQTNQSKPVPCWETRHGSRTSYRRQSQSLLSGNCYMGLVGRMIELKHRSRIERKLTAVMPTTSVVAAWLVAGRLWLSTVVALPWLAYVKKSLSHGSTWLARRTNQLRTAGSPNFTLLAPVG
jgi:hypothetical protein